MALTRRTMLAGAAAALTVRPVWAGGTRALGGRAFGGMWRAVVSEGTDVARVAATVEAVVAEVDRAVSPWRADSEIAAFNAAGTTAPHPVGPIAAAVVGAAAHAADRTGGAFDPRVGPVVALYGFGPVRGGRVAGAYRLDGAALVRSDPGLTLDLCGVAKGWALDRIGAALAAEGVGGALIDLGGDLRAFGGHPAGRPWQVAIERPGGGVQRILDPRGLAVATSGPAVQGHDGRGAVSHIVDPAARRPADTRLRAVTVLHPDGAQADALATGLAAAGPVEGPALARDLGVAALFQIRSSDGLTETATGTFATHVVA
ncbi:FAD:protein FMN transferase [Rhodobacteraceae bacterium CCMM004]|nr:FAD:protein FMN transferase [Rhodobacteraceae bacterium CCMM004]